MAKRLNERQWRDAKDEAVKALTTQQDAMGLAKTPTLCEQFFEKEVAPGLRRNEEVQPKREAAKEREKAKAQEAQREATEVLRAGEARRPGDGELTALGRKRGIDVPDKWEIRWGGDIREPEKPKESTITMCVRQIFRGMRHLPEWRHRVEEVLRKYPPVEREKPLQKILHDWIRLKGDPVLAIAPRERKIISSG